MRASSTGLWASRGGGRILPLFLLLQNTVFGKYVLMDFMLIPLAISLDMISSERDYMRALGEESGDPSSSPDYTPDSV